MSIHNFLNFNKKCPICQNPLSLYWQWIDSPLFKAIEVEPRTYYFAKYNPKEHEYDSKDDRSMTLFDYGDKFSTSFSCPSLLTDAKKPHTYFYYLCKETGFDSRNLNHYEINLARSCYYRSSPLMEFGKTDNGWKLDYVIQEFAGLPYKDESFCVKRKITGADKIYMVNRDLEKKATQLFYFTITDEERKAEKKPDVFRKELPLIERPSFESHAKIISRLDTWIIMS